MDFKSLVPFGRPRGGEFDPFSGMRREMERLYDEVTRDWSIPAPLAGSTFLNPKINVSETDKGLEVTADLPGVDKNDIELDLTENVLTLKARHATEKEEKDEKKQYHLIERQQGTYLRRIPLPFAAEPDKVEASFDKGVLKVMVPRAAATEKPVTKIAVKGG